ncbi:MAG: queuosine precursor transporter [Bifidobacteriaceae bacterium]|nr:queuosine precursor transporter [Bifidobacteriaceae bacterium]
MPTQPDPPSGPPPGATRGWYAGLVGLFTALLVISNVSAVKLIGLGSLGLGGLDLDLTVDGGAFLFPVTYILGDVLAEVYGFRATRRAILLGFFCSALAVASFWLVQAAPPAANWGGQAAYEATLGFVPRIVAASLAGYLAGQLSNALVLTAMKRRSGGRALWRRLLGSTAVGEAADTAVFCVIAFYGVIRGAQFAGYLVLGYVYKCLVEALLLPVTYRVVAAVKRHDSPPPPSSTMPSA